MKLTVVRPQLIGHHELLILECEVVDVVLL